MKADIKDNSPVTYPAQYETEVVLTDGSAMVLRPIKPERSNTSAACRVMKTKEWSEH